MAASASARVGRSVVWASLWPSAWVMSAGVGLLSLGVIAGPLNGVGQPAPVAAIPPPCQAYMEANPPKRNNLGGVHLLLSTDYLLRWNKLFLPAGAGSVNLGFLRV